MDLSKLIAEGFETKFIRQKLTARGVAYKESDQSIVLLEKLGAAISEMGAAPLEGLRMAQRIRSKVKGHSGSREGSELSQAALIKHESFAAHFESVCSQIFDELHAIEAACSM
jgi:hypothetical protein